jgi:hypothetical protein
VRRVEAEDIIRAELDQSAIQITADHGQIAHAPSVDRKGDGWFRLGAIDEIVGSAVHHHVGPQIAKKGTQLIGIRQVGLLARQSVDLAGQTRTQIATELAIRPKNRITHHDEDPFVALWTFEGVIALNWCSSAVQFSANGLARLATLRIDRRGQPPAFSEKRDSAVSLPVLQKCAPFAIASRL